MQAGTVADIAANVASVANAVVDAKQGQIPTPTPSILNYNSKFTPDGYNQYVSTYNNLYKLTNDNPAELSSVSTGTSSVKKLTSQLTEAANNILLYDKYLTPNTHDNIISIINDRSVDAKYRARLIAELQNHKLSKLNTQLDTLNTAADTILTDSTIPSGPFYSIKNQSTSQILNIEPIPTKFDTSKHSKAMFSASPEDTPYLIYGNRGCLTVQPNDNNNRSSGTNNTNTYDYKFAPCNADKTAGQQFLINKIDNYQKYNNFLGPNSSVQRISSNTIVPLGYYVVTPNSANAGNMARTCVTLGDSGLTVEPCDMRSGQKFNGYYTHAAI